MKHLIVLIASLCFLVACTETDAVNGPIESSNEQISQSSIRSVDDAISIAVNARIDFGIAKSRETDNVSSVVDMEKMFTI